MIVLATGTAATVDISSNTFVLVPLTGSTTSYTVGGTGVDKAVMVVVDVNGVTIGATITIKVEIGAASNAARHVVNYNEAAATLEADCRLITKIIPLVDGADDWLKVWVESSDAGDSSVAIFGTVFGGLGQSSPLEALVAAPLTAADVNTQVDNALDTLIPGSPTSGSINERMAAVDDLTQASGAGDLAVIKASTDDVPGDVLDELIDDHQVNGSVARKLAAHTRR